MSKKIVWGLGILIILFIGVSVVVLTRTTDTKPPITIYRGDTEPLNPNPTLNTKDNPQPAEPGYKWVWHENHWDKVPIDVLSEPIKPHPIPVAENGQTSKKTDLSKDEGKPIDEDFYREYMKVHSRERLEENMKSDQKFVKYQRTVIIPGAEEIRKKRLKSLQDYPELRNSKAFMEIHAANEKRIKNWKRICDLYEEKIAMMSNVLNEEVSHNEK